MGGKRWHVHEEEVFWEVIVPLSPVGHDGASRKARAKTEDEAWVKLAQRMKQEMLARFPGEELLRKYDHVLCYEHYFQNFKRCNYSPNARRFVDAYRARLAGAVNSNGQTPIDSQTSSAYAAPQDPIIANGTKATYITSSKARRQEKTARRLASAQTRQKLNTASSIDERPDDVADHEDDADDAIVPAYPLARPGSGYAQSGYDIDQMFYCQPTNYLYSLHNPQSLTLAQQYLNGHLASFQVDKDIHHNSFQIYGFPPERGVGCGYDEHGFRQNVGHDFGRSPAGQNVSAGASGIASGYPQSGYRQDPGGQAADRILSTDTATGMVPVQGMMLGTGFGYDGGPPTPYTPTTRFGDGRFYFGPGQAASNGAASQGMLPGQQHEIMSRNDLSRSPPRSRPLSRDYQYSASGSPNIDEEKYRIQTF